MTTFTLPGIALILALTGLLTSPVSGQNEVDKELAAEYAKIEKSLSAMSGEMNDEDRRERMGAFQESCRSVIEKFKDRSATLTTGCFDLARVYIHMASPADAIGLLERYVALEPAATEREEARLLLGDAYMSTNRLADAVRVYEAFLASPAKEGPKAAFARIGLARAYFLDLRWDEAERLLRDIMVKDAQHEVAADAAIQLVETFINTGKYAEAVALCDQLLADNKEAPELQRLRDVAAMCGKPAPVLGDVVAWVGDKGTSLESLRGRVVVLCFMINWSVPCARELRFLSEMQNEFGTAGLTTYGLTKTYKAGKSNWTVESEADWLRRYRENPRFVIERDLRLRKGQVSENDEIGDSDEQLKEIELPITVPIAMVSTFENHKAYLVRGVPWTVVIDKAGKVRLAKEGGSLAGGFQRRLVREMVKRLLAE